MAVHGPVAELERRHAVARVGRHVQPALDLLVGGIALLEQRGVLAGAVRLRGLGGEPQPARGLRVVAAALGQQPQPGEREVLPGLRRFAVPGHGLLELAAALVQQGEMQDGVAVAVLGRGGEVPLGLGVVAGLLGRQTRLEGIEHPPIFAHRPVPRAAGRAARPPVRPPWRSSRAASSARPCAATPSAPPA